MPNYESRFSWKARAKSFTYAWAGIRQLFRTEHNAWLHLAVTLAAAGLGAALGISRGEGIALLVVTALVWMAELFNTCLEKTLDLISAGYHPQVKTIKDMAAAAVLLSALAAVVVGAIVFLPRLL